MSKERKQGGKLIIKQYFDRLTGRVGYHKYRTRLQVIEANKSKGSKRRTVLHYDLTN